MLQLKFINKWKIKQKKIKLEEEKEEENNSLLKITLDFITKKCKNEKDEKTNQLLDIKWHEVSLFCLAFKIKEKLFTKCFWWSLCICEPFKCERFCMNTENHQQVS